MIHITNLGPKGEAGPAGAVGREFICSLIISQKREHSK